MTLPNFLIIGGMKCGSTTLYRDLQTNPAVYFPIDKEPHNLAHDDVLTESGKAEYAALFDNAGGATLIGEASTGYTKRPDIDRAAERARDVLGSDLRLLYIIREPVSRIASHHHHARTEGVAMPEDLGDAIVSHPELLNYSRYAMQAKPWVETFGSDQLQILRFEDYTRARAATVAELSTFLGIDPRPDLVQEDEVYNKSEAKPVMTGRWRAITSSAPYRAIVRPLMSQDVRDRVRRALLPKSKQSKAAVSPEVAEAIYDQLAPDLEDLMGLMNATSPIWDRDKVIARYREKAMSTTTAK